MKTSAVLFSLLLLIGWLIGCLGAPVTRPAPHAGPTIEWRRTAGGWENAAAWRTWPTSTPPRLHPGVVASFCLLASLLALLAGSGLETPAHPAARQAGQAAPAGQAPASGASGPS